MLSALGQHYEDASSNRVPMLMTRRGLDNIVHHDIKTDQRRLDHAILMLEKYNFIFREATIDRGMLYGLTALKERYPDIVAKIRKLKLQGDESYFIIHGTPEKYVLLRLQIKPPPDEEKKDRRRTR